MSTRQLEIESCVELRSQNNYSISPTLVKWFGETSWFKRLWRKPSDKLVASLRNKGVEDTPYIDKYYFFWFVGLPYRAAAALFYRCGCRGTTAL